MKNQPTPAKPKQRWTADAIYTNLSYVTMVLPGTIWLILFAYLPMPGIIMAFKNYRLQKPPADSWIQNRFIYSLIESPWVGLDNFRYLVNPVNLENTTMFVRNRCFTTFCLWWWGWRLRWGWR